MYLIPLAACFISSLFNGSMIGRALGHRGSIVIAISCLAVAFISSLLIWIEVCIMGCPVSIDLWGPWFNVGSFNANWTLNYDLLTAHMLLTVTGVSFAVHMYASDYMRSDPHQSLFLSYLSLFTAFMLVLVAADNLVLMLVGWEGIGVCSYLLIGYWSHRLSAVKSAQKAILVNRVSDGMLMWGIIWIWYHLGSLEYDLLNVYAASQNPSFIGLTILIGAMGKSAQILFHVWLADAMEGPTPVSALIHAATLVTAGVYLLVRLHIHDETFVILVGSLTAFMAGIFGAHQSDIKRVIAFSTCSQLGYMMVSVGLGEIGGEASMGHLMTHASFKAALFLAAGMVITGAGGNQHMARYGGSAHSSLFCMLTLMVGSLSLVGWPELSGFYSKETILNLAVVCADPIADVAHNLLLLTALLTSAYTTKLFFQSFILDYSGSFFVYLKNASHYAGAVRNVLPTLAMALLLVDVMMKVWVGTNLLSGILFFVPWGVKTLPFGLVLAGILTATAAVGSERFTLIRFCGTRWGFDQLFARSPVNPILDWGRITWAVGDKGITYPKINY
jgi:proton-translocating NADH-quinone oxidoreductase chain L